MSMTQEMTWLRNRIDQLENELRSYKQQGMVAGGTRRARYKVKLTEVLQPGESATANIWHGTDADGDPVDSGTSITVWDWNAGYQPEGTKLNAERNEDGRFWVFGLSACESTDTGTGTGTGTGGLCCKIPGVNMDELPVIDAGAAGYVLGMDINGCLCRIPIGPDCDPATGTGS